MIQQGNKKFCGVPRIVSRSSAVGFTLIELLVAVAVFSVAIAAMAGIFLSVVNAQRKAAALQATQEASRFLLESMAKEIRMSVVNSNTNASIHITNPNGETFDYTFSGGQLYRNNEQISPDNVEIVIGRFRVEQLPLPPDDPLATKVTIVMALKGKGTKVEQQAQLNLETTISTRAQ